ncbi:MAG: response regulator transcription factor [Erysipelotrichaceae bacterium]
MNKILIVDDEINIRNAIGEYAIAHGYDIDTVGDGYEAIDLVYKNDYNLIILDLMMPNLDGYSTCRQIKKIKDVPIIILSARTSEDDKLLGFELGADDYIVKPFSMKELMARIKVVLSRNKVDATDIFVYKGLEVNLKSHSIKINGIKINTTPKEFDLLAHLIENKNIALSRKHLVKTLWGYDYDGDDRTIDTHIKMLRKNLGEYRDIVVTVRSMGYMLEIQ